MKKRNILLIALKTGGGHIAIANAIKSILDEDKYNVIICSDLHDPLYFDKSSGIYKALSKVPYIWDFLWEISNNPFVPVIFNLYSELNARKNLSYFRSQDPDIIISINPLIGAIPKYVSKKLGIPCAIFVNDPYSIHYAWLSPKLDYCIVPFSETKEEIANMTDVDNVKVLTFPINKKFIESKDSRSRIFSELGLMDQFTVLCSSGGDGQIRLNQIKLLLKGIKADMNLIIICGKNENLYNKLINHSLIKGKKNIKIIGYTNKMADILSISDIHFTKGGPNNIYETLISKSIPYVYTSLGGQEKGNVDMVEQRGLGKTGKMKSLVKDIPLTNIEKSEISKNISNYLNEKKITDGVNIFNEFFDQMFASEYIQYSKQSYIDIRGKYEKASEVIKRYIVK